MDERIIREFPVKGRLFSKDYQPEPGLAGKGRRMQTHLRDTFLNVFDHLGAEAWLTGFVRKSDENARVFVNGLLRMVPLEVHGNVDTSLIVKVVSHVGSTEVDITKAKPIREERVAPPALPAERVQDLAPRDP